MPQPTIVLSKEELQKILDTEPGIFAREQTRNFRKVFLDTHSELLEADPGFAEQLPEPKNHQELWDNFQRFCAKESTFDGNINSGLYIRIDDLIDKLTEFKTEIGDDGKPKELSHVYISFGLRVARKAPGDETQEIDWNCFHLILQGANPIAEFENTPTPIADSLANSVKEPLGAKLTKKPSVVSENRYSTYNGDEQKYLGPKPGCPPFGAPEQTR